MQCPRCGRPGVKAFEGYCTRVHRLLDKKPAKLLYECAGCGRPVPRTSSQVTETGRVFCNRCPKNAGEQHYKWKEGQYLNSAGYRLILVGNDYRLEHIYVWEQANKAKILREARAHVHHVNMIKNDNRPDNLLLLSAAEHGRIHRYMESKPYLALRLLKDAGNRQLWFPNEILKLRLVNR